MKLEHIEMCRKNELLYYIRLIEELVAFLIKKKKTEQIFKEKLVKVFDKLICYVLFGEIDTVRKWITFDSFKFRYEFSKQLNAISF